VFFVVAVSALVQGTTLERVAAGTSLLGRRFVAAPLEVDALGSLELVDFTVAADHAIAGAAVRELGLPRSALIAGYSAVIGSSRIGGADRIDRERHAMSLFVRVTDAAATSFVDPLSSEGGSQRRASAGNADG
jgi:NhaP-type Na+/H+ and K+/H+ antiporter